MVIGVRLRCTRKHPIECNHVWTCKTENFYWATCPKCRTKVNVRKAALKKKEYERMREIYMEAQESLNKKMNLIKQK